MFRKEFAEVIAQTGMIPVKDLRPLMVNKDPGIISELEVLKFSFFDDIKFAKLVSEKSGVAFVDLAKAQIGDNILSLLKRKDIIQYRVLPIQKTGQAVTVAIYDPSILSKTAELQKLFQHPVEFVFTNIASWKTIFQTVSVSIDELIDSVKMADTESDDSTPDIRAEDIGDDVITYVNRIMADSYVRKASDIHIEPYENDFRIRFRIDGVLIVVLEPPRNMMLPVISRVKIMAQLDISEKRKPQDGRIKLLIGGKPIDFRVSSLPTLFGEKIVLRLLDSSNLELDMTKLGFEESQLKVFHEGISRPFGMCLVTGPTGSGKTTTLYSGLAELNKPEKNISTAEDPVEFNLMGINQVNVKKDIGLTFAAALKSFLRQDPDIIMVGEIRDFETGEIAVEAALTGHLVLSTLHTNDAPSTITRLMNMGIEAFLLVGSLNVVVAQRLCRRICTSCRKVDDSISEEALIQCGFSPNSAKKIKVYNGKGCKFCNNTGYKGRVAIYEVLGVTPMIKDLILRNASSDEIKKQAIKEGMKTLRMAALTKVAQGLTTIDEAVSNSGSDKFS